MAGSRGVKRSRETDEETTHLNPYPAQRLKAAPSLDTSPAQSSSSHLLPAVSVGESVKSTTPKSTSDKTKEWKPTAFEVGRPITEHEFKWPE